MEVSVPAPMPLDFSITVKSRQQEPPSSSPPGPASQSPPATGLVLPATSSAGLLKLLKESGARTGTSESPLSSSAFRVVTPKEMEFDLHTKLLPKPGNMLNTINIRFYSGSFTGHWNDIDPMKPAGSPCGSFMIGSFRTCLKVGLCFILLNSSHARP
ncbi:hypothetical protein L9F63_004606, partial [Diploptera punctata]